MLDTVRNDVDVEVKNKSVETSTEKPVKVRVTSHKAYLNGYMSAILNSGQVHNPYKENLKIWASWNRGRIQGCKVRSHFSVSRTLNKREHEYDDSVENA